MIGKATVQLFESRHAGIGQPVFIIAEIGASHQGNESLAEKLIEEAAQCGADAVKLQVIDPKASYVPESPSFDIFDKLWLNETSVQRLMQVAKRCGVELFTTPGSPEDLKRLVDVGMRLVKVSSGLMTHHPLVRLAAQTELSLIISTGMKFLDEVAATVRVAEEAGCQNMVLLHCTSLYPAPDNTLNLRSLDTLKQSFGYPVGYSDHSDGLSACLAATTLGACVLEKHFTLDRAGGGPDDHFSADANQFKALVREVRSVEKMLGDGIKKPHADEMTNRELFHRCLVAKRCIQKGEILDAHSIAFKRPKPGNPGLAPSLLPHILGLKASRSIETDENIAWESLTGQAHE